MDADQNRVALGVGDGNAVAQGDKGIVGARHHRADAGLAQVATKPPGDVERQVFFTDALTGNAAAVLAAVPGIDDSGVESEERGTGKEEAGCEQPAGRAKLWPGRWPMLAICAGFKRNCA